MDREREPGELGPEAESLQTAIIAAPADEAPQLVLADLLLAHDDPRGELIVLHRRELAGELQEPEALDRYLVLAAVYGFPRAEPEEPPLDFIQSSAAPPRYDVWFGGRAYQVRCVGRLVEVLVDGHPVFQRRLRLASRDAFTTFEATTILRHVGDAIRAGTPLRGLQLPFVPNPLPSYDGGAVRSYRLPADFRRTHGLGRSEHGLAARDYARFIALWRQSQTKPAAGPSAS